jgi:hypothetical protein
MKHLLPPVIIFLVALFTFGELKNTFFQQDEWLGLGSAFFRRDSGGVSKVIYDIFNNPSSRFLPLTSLTNYFVFNAIKFSFSTYGYMAIVLACINTYLVYLFVSKLLGSKTVGLIVGLFWLVNGMSFQAITWISPVVPSQLAFMFMLLGFNYFLKYLQSPAPKLVSFITLLITCSLLYKETGVFFIFIIPLLVLLKKDLTFIKFHLPHLLIITFVPILVANLSPKFFLPKLSTVFGLLQDEPQEGILMVEEIL